MQLNSQQILPASQIVAWEALNDIDILKACIPGCESLVSVADNEFELMILAVVGPVKARFKGKLRLSDLQPPSGYLLQFEGQGGAAGHGKGSAEVRLESQSSERTVLRYTATATVGGKMAQIGSRLIDMAAQRMATEFFTAFTAQLQERATAPTGTAAADADSSSAPPTTAPGWLRRLFAFLRRLLCGRPIDSPKKT